MLSLEQINKEVDLYNKYVNQDLPYIKDVVYSNSMQCDAKIITSDLELGKYIIYISSNTNNYLLEYQKSIVWHEFTHISDYLIYRENANIGDILKSISEAHAESIRLRYLLHLPINKTLNRERRVIAYKEKKDLLDNLTGNYGNQSIAAITVFDRDNDPLAFDHAITNFCYMCGYLTLLKEQDKIKICNYIISLYPQEYKDKLYALSHAILENDVVKSALTYKKIKLSAMIKSYRGVIDNDFIGL